MSIQTMYSQKSDVAGVLDDLKARTQTASPKLVVYFASSRFPQAELSAAIQDLYPSSVVIGCSTAGEIASGRVMKGSVVVMLLGADEIEDVAVEVVKDIRTENHIPQAFHAFETYYGTPMSALDFTRYVGIILADGLAGAEERLMDKIGDLTNVFFVGGSAGDDLAFKATTVCAGGKAYTNAAVLALVKPKVKFDIIKTQSFCTLDKKLVATEVDEAARKVITFDNIPAAEAYARALGVPLAEAADRFMSNPVGLMVGDEPYVRSPQKLEGGSIVFYCNIAQGMELSVLESGDIVQDTRAVLAAKEKELGGIAGLINFNCILRTLELEKKGQTEAYGEVFASIPTVGFSTYGEEYLGHINQTATMLVFAKS